MACRVKMLWNIFFLKRYPGYLLETGYAGFVVTVNKLGGRIAMCGM